MQTNIFNNTLYKYNSVYDVFCEWAPAEKFNALTPDDKIALLALDDYEYFSYYVMDGKTIYICDGLDGGNIISASTLDFYINETIKYITETEE